MMQLNFLAGGMLRCSGNMKVPSMLGVLMCVLDVIFNFLFIFPSRTITVFGLPMHMPGLGLGVEGAALGTVAAETIVAVAMLWYMWTRSGQLKLTHEKGSFIPEWTTLKKAMRIGLPMGIEHVVICGAQIMTTVIVAPLGVFAIAANSFGVTAESLCYMPGYGIADPTFRMAYRRDGHDCDGIHGCADVYLRARDNRLHEPGDRNPGTRRDGNEDRGVRGADVRRLYRGLRSVCRCASSFVSVESYSFFGFAGGNG